MRARSVTDRMTRIGFAYNQKPEALANGAVAARVEEEPPSIRRDKRSRTSDSPALSAERAGGHSASPLDQITLADEFAEWDAPETIDAVAAALAQLGEVIRLEAGETFPERLRAARPDIVFNIAEGLHGPNRESHVPAICEFFGIPYSGSDPLTLSLCLHKARTKEILAHNGIPTAPFVLVTSRAQIRGLTASLARGANGATSAGALGLPVFVKPVHEGSSKGITERNFCRDAREVEEQIEFLLERYQQPVLVESYLPGPEFTCAVLGNGASARVLPIVAMRFDTLPDGALPIYGFEAKWLWDRPERPLDIFECPARISDELRREIEDVTLRSYELLGCRDWSRIDVRLDGAGVPNIVEINPLPGILPNPEDNSCFPKAARAEGMSYDELIQACARSAARRYGMELGARSPARGGRAADSRKRARAVPSPGAGRGDQSLESRRAAGA